MTVGGAVFPPPYARRVGRGTRTTSAEADRSIGPVLAEQTESLRPRQMPCDQVDRLAGLHAVCGGISIFIMSGVY